MQGTIFKALSGFYYVSADGREYECRARGKFRKDGMTPLVGDRVIIQTDGGSKGTVTGLLERKNAFVRPPIANIDYMVIIISAVIPVADTYLVDRLTAIARKNNCDCILCINKCDMDAGDSLYETYSAAGFKTLRVSAQTGQGVDELYNAIAGAHCAFTGNSGVGKSSILNAMCPELELKTADVSSKLGRGRHTTRHVEMFTMPNGAMIADTPGFSAFDTEQAGVILKDELADTFIEFEPYIGSCRYTNCSHTSERGCAVLKALSEGKIQPSRHNSYVRMYEQAKQINRWD